MTVHRTHLIGIAGASCSGKTELSRRLSLLLSAPILSLDAYYRELGHLPLEERSRMNFDVPQALDADLFIEHVRALARGEAIDHPTYDFARHTRTGRLERVVPGDVTIVEGLFVLHWPEVREILSTKVFIEVDGQTCFDRRLDRDVRERGRTAESVYRQYNETVRPMAERWVLPARRYADVVVSGVQPLDESSAAVVAAMTRMRQGV
jgi:uridine kinase